MSGETQTRIYSKAQLLELCQKNPTNMYISIHENVIDVTKFSDEHPGGVEALKEHQIRDKFKDATQAFEDVGHSVDARDMMKKYIIGKLDTPGNRAKKTESEKPKDQNVNNCTTCNSTWLIPIILAVGLAVLYKYYL